MRRFFASFALLLAWIAPAASDLVLAQVPLRIAAAADLEPVLPRVLDQFRQANRIAAQATYQSSAALTTQIQNGAPFDILLSANLDYPRKLIAAGLAEGPGAESEPVVYANGTLVLWSRKDSTLPRPSLALLRNPGLRRLAIANPERAPYGQAALALLNKLGFYQSLKTRLVTAENVAQAAQFVDSGNADAGLISLTSALSPRLAASGNYYIIPADLYPSIEQGAVLIKATQQREAARKFLDFLMSAAVQKQLSGAGLSPGRPLPFAP